MTSSIKLILRPPRPRWDDWVPQDRLRKLTDENKELAQNLKKEMDALRQRTAPPKAPTTSTKKKAAGSDLSSGRGSEERHSSLPATGRGQKRGRDYEIEKVGGPPDFAYSSPLNPSSTSTLSSASSGRSSMEDTTHVIVLDTAAATPGPFHHAHVHSPELQAGAVNAAPSTASVRRGRSRNLWQKERDAVGGIEDDAKASLLPTAEKILSRPAPVDSGRKAMLRKEPERAPLEQHPQLAKLNVNDPGNEPKRQFFKAQDARSVLMLAGYSKDYSLHPLRSNCGGNPNDHDNNTWQEESFLQRPAVRIVIPDHLKAILVDDWENVTKNLSLVPLPSKHPVNEILDAYWDEEKGKRRYGSAEADLLEEVVAGVREYFEKCLGRILLYRFEREQFFEVRQLWEAGTGEWEGKGVGDVYGAEHLCRLFGMSPVVAPLSIELLTGCRSHNARAHRANEHGPAVGESFERRIGEADAMAG